MVASDRSGEVHAGGPLVLRALGSTVASLFASRARSHPERIAVEDGARARSYGELALRTRHLAGALVSRGVKRGDRVAILSENRAEYLEVVLAAARLGAIVACPSWRLAPAELDYCLELVAPVVTFVSDRHRDKLPAGRAAVILGPEHERLATASTPLAFEVSDDVEPEEP